MRPLYRKAVRHVKGNWPVYTVLTVLLTLIIAFLLFTNLKFLLSPDIQLDKPKTNYYQATTEKVDQIPSGTPLPSGNQRGWYALTTVGSVQYDITPLAVNSSYNTFSGTHVFQVDYYNTTNQAVTPQGDDLKALNLGCVAKTKPFQLTPVDVKPMSFPPLTSTKITVELNANCMFLGTADGKYFWWIHL